ncbi:MAG: hypothetical protein Q4P23_05640 [Micrococcaceae bacterium]|nr:hypothetical protein [Micrococcaceae bacterium]
MKVRFILLVLCLVAATVPAVPGPGSGTHPYGGPGPSVCHRVEQLEPAYPAGSGDRLLFALAQHYGDTRVVVTSCVRTRYGFIEDWQAPGYIGETGFAVPGSVRVNTLKTPTGSFTMTEAFGRRDPGTALMYRAITPESRWGGSRGRDFNNYFEGRGSRKDEPLWRYMQDGDYEQAAVINFNRPPDAEPDPRQTFAIFLHAGLQETWGCISTDLPTVTRVLREASPGDRIIMGVESEIFPPG